MNLNLRAFMTLLPPPYTCRAYECALTMPHFSS